MSTNLLARHLGVTPASVTGMLRRLAELGLVTYRRYHHIALTEEGERRAHDVIRRHRLAERLLTDLLSVPLEEAHAEACLLEHAVSPALVPRLVSALGSPESCPHGHPVDAGRPDDTIPLTEAPTGRPVTVARLGDESREVVRYLAERRLLPGAVVTVTEREPRGAAISLEVEGVRHTLSHSLAASIRVQRPRGRRKT